MRVTRGGVVQPVLAPRSTIAYWLVVPDSGDQPLGIGSCTTPERRSPSVLSWIWPAASGVSVPLTAHSQVSGTGPAGPLGASGAQPGATPGGISKSKNSPSVPWGGAAARVSTICVSPPPANSAVGR